jgi:DNA-binding beta-propeller fold protein YncE
MKIRLLAVAAALATAAAAPTPGVDKPDPGPPVPVSLTVLSTLKTGVVRGDDPRVAEINAFDAVGRRIYVVNPLNSRVDIIDASSPAALTQAVPGSIDIAAACQAVLGLDCPVPAGSEPNSVAIHGNLMGVALANTVRTENGFAVFFELQGTQPPRFVAAVEAGALPDMITFTEDGQYALTANEGEPSADYTVDPPGSVSIITIARLGQPGAARHVGFERFESPGMRQGLERDGVRIFGPGATVSQDLEPEYVGVDGHKAYVTLQENNALAIINIAAATVERIVGLGLKDHAVSGLGLDPSDQDSSPTNNGINIGNWPVSGLYQADAVHAFSVRGRTYLMMANEGDAREYAGYEEALRLGNVNYPLDPTVFPPAQTAALKATSALGRLNVSTASGDLDGDGDFDRIDVFGARSVSIRDQQGRLLWDSGELLERLSAFWHWDPATIPLVPGKSTIFNTTNTANSRDNRSDDKSIEPESVATGELNGRPYAFVGLERDSGIAVFDLSDPESPALVQYINNRKFPRNPTTGAFLTCNDTNDCGDVAPRG